jgi:hypothetical protein
MGLMDMFAKCKTGSSGMLWGGGMNIALARSFEKIQEKSTFVDTMLITPGPTPFMLRYRYSTLKERAAYKKETKSDMKTDTDYPELIIGNGFSMGRIVDWMIDGSCPEKADFSSMLDSRSECQGLGDAGEYECRKVDRSVYC